MAALDRQARGNLEQERLPFEEQEVGKEQSRKAQPDNGYLAYGFRQKRLLSHSGGKSLALTQPRSISHSSLQPQKSTQVEQMLIAGDSFSESDLVHLLSQILRTPQGTTTLNIEESASFKEFGKGATSAAASFTALQLQQLYILGLVFQQSQ